MGFSPTADLGTTSAGSGGVFDMNGMEMESQAWRVQFTDGGQRDDAVSFCARVAAGWVDWCR